MWLLLPVDLSLKEGDLTTAAPVIETIVFYMVYWFISQSEKVRSYFYNKSDFDTASVRYFLFTKLLGFTVLGVIPLIISLFILHGYSFSDFGLTHGNETFSLSVISTLSLAVVIAPLASMAARKAQDHEVFPQIRARVWTNKTIAANISGWFVYLLGYETLFRGVLLMPLATQLGIWPAVSINIALYSAVHIPQGARNAIGAIPVGLVFCLVTLATGTIWIAFFIHLTMALTNCFTAMIFHPDIKYRKR